ncbi:MAG: FtsX-like permease family protein [Phycisphaera sp.]|nr:FtsX-like permease family protein [Phycisphaera sp.]
MTPMQQIAILPYRKVIAIAMRGLRFRLVKTFLVTCCIALALAFLTYILCSNGMTAHLADRASDALQQRLAREGMLDQLKSADKQSQTAWMLGIALLISFVGIVNAMLISVTERFREIGTMKCLGGLDSFIVKLYLIESLFQGVVGTVLGMVIGVILAYVEGVGRFGGDTWNLLPPGELAVLLVVTFGTGIVLTVAGALYPAWRAAKMEPVDAMRSEV